MVATAAEPTTARILVFNLHGSAGNDLARALRRQGFAALHSQLVSGRLPAEGEVAAAIVSAPALDPALRVAAQRFRAAYPRTPLLLWAPLEPARLMQALDCGFTCWLPAAVPPAAVAMQVSTVLRWLDAATSVMPPEVVTVRNVTVDFQRCEVAVNGSPAPLTPTEFRIISRLASRPGRVVTHQELFREVYGHDTAEQEAKDMLKVHIWRLRSKLTTAGAADDLIVNVRGFGYLLERRASRTADAAAAPA